MLFFNEVGETFSFYLLAGLWSVERTWEFAVSKVLWSVPVGLVSLMIGAFLRFRRENKIDGAVVKSGIIGALGGPAIVFVLGTILNLIYYPVLQYEDLNKIKLNLAQTPPPPPKQFFITPGWGWLSVRLSNYMTKDSLGKLASGGALDGKYYLHPIDWMVYVTLSNNQNIPTRIENYTAYYKEDNGTWAKFCRVALLKSAIFFINEKFKKVQILSTEKAIDNRLSEQTIQPHDSVSGWIAFECPLGLGCGDTVKLTIREANGRVSETDPFPLSSTDAPLHDSLPQPIDVNRDLSSADVLVSSSCMRPGTTGLSGFFPDMPGK